MRAIRGGVLGLALTLGLYSFIVAQSFPRLDDHSLLERDNQRVDDLKERIAVIEAQRLDARVSNLEQAAQSNHELLLALIGMVSSLIVEVLFRVVRKKKES